MIDILRAAFADDIAAGTHDVVQDDPADDIEIQTDHWTIVLPPGPAGLALIALDDLTESDAEHNAGLDAAFSAHDLDRLHHADVALDGALVRRLASSPDRLAVLLAKRLG